MHLGIFSSNHYKSIVWGGLGLNTNKAKEATGQTQAPQHHHAELAEGWIRYCDEPNNMT